MTQHVNRWSERTIVLRHLTPATSSTFTVEARDSCGDTATSNLVTLTTEATPDVAPSSAPTKLRIREDEGCAEARLGWT